MEYITGDFVGLILNRGFEENRMEQHEAQSIEWSYHNVKSFFEKAFIPGVIFFATTGLGWIFKFTYLSVLGISIPSSSLHGDFNANIIGFLFGASAYLLFWRPFNKLVRLIQFIIIGAMLNLVYLAINFGLSSPFIYFGLRPSFELICHVIIFNSTLIFFLVLSTKWTNQKKMAFSVFFWMFGATFLTIQMARGLASTALQNRPKENSVTVLDPRLQEFLKDQVTVVAYTDASHYYLLSWSKNSSASYQVISVPRQVALVKQVVP